MPAWAVAPGRGNADLTGRYWTLVAIDSSADATGPAALIVADWTKQILATHPDANPRVHRVADDRAALAAVTTDLSCALVGWRLMIAGPANLCLRLRAHALAHHVGDDEIVVASTDVTHRDVYCVHCRAVTRAAVELDDVLECAGCGRRLAVQAHVSRRIGAHLGVLAHAEDVSARADP